MIRTLTVLVYRGEADEGGYWAEVAELPGCVSQGETLDELDANIREAISLWLEIECEDPGHPNPAPVTRWSLEVPEPIVPASRA
jgi:predicted RNase H-like HicB family nuclease